MSVMSQTQVHETVLAACGQNVELSRNVEQMILDAYTRGRADAFEMLGLDEAEFQDETESVAWTV